MEKLFEYASEYAKGYADVGYDDDQIASVRDAFIDGAKWHKNHVWHTNEEQPINGKEALIEYGNDWHDVGFYYTDSDSFQIGLEDYVERSRVARWAYLEDLESL